MKPKQLIAHSSSSLKLLLLLALTLFFQNCSPSTKEPDQSEIGQQPIQSDVALKDVSEVPLEPIQSLDSGSASLADLRDLLEKEYRDVPFRIQGLKVYANDFLVCGREALISESAASIFRQLLTFSDRSEFEAYRESLDGRTDLDNDSKAILAMLITHGVKNFALENHSYPADLERAYTLLTEISDHTLLSNLILADAFYEEYGPFLQPTEQVEEILADAELTAKYLESGLRESDQFTSLIIQGIQTSTWEEHALIWLKGESLCEDSAFFTVDGLFQNPTEYLSYKDNDAVLEKVNRLIESGLPLFHAKQTLYEQEFEFNSNYTGLAETAGTSQIEFAMLAQEAYVTGIDHHVNMGQFDTWCRSATTLSCNPFLPYDPQYVEALEKLAARTNDSYASLELSRHYENIGDLDKAIFHKWAEYQLDKWLVPNATAEQLTDLGDLILLNYGVAATEQLLSIVHEYESEYLPSLSMGDTVYFWQTELANDVARYARSLTLVNNSVADTEADPDEPSSLSAISLGRYHALLIANTNYANLPDLITPETDVTRIEDLLTNRYGFETKTLLDASRSEILNSLNEYRDLLSEGDNLLVYYAGHGYIDPANDEAYWQPIDSELENDTNWISTNRVISSLRAIDANNIVVLADSCFSGALMREVQPIVSVDGEEGLNLSVIQQLSAEKSRIAISSGALEPVVDQLPGSQNSVFATAVIRFLESNTREVFTGRDLHLAVSAIVNSITDGTGISQSPLYSPLIRAGHDGGDFIFSSN